MAAHVLAPIVLVASMFLFLRLMQFARQHEPGASKRQLWTILSLLGSVWILWGICLFGVPAGTIRCNLDKVEADRPQERLIIEGPLLLVFPKIRYEGSDYYYPVISSSHPLYQQILAHKPIPEEADFQTWIHHTVTRKGSKKTIEPARQMDYLVEVVEPQWPGRPALRKDGKPAILLGDPGLTFFFAGGRWGVLGVGFLLLAIGGSKLRAERRSQGSFREQPAPASVDESTLETLAPERSAAPLAIKVYLAIPILVFLPLFALSTLDWKSWIFGPGSQAIATVTEQHDGYWVYQYEAGGGTYKGIQTVLPDRPWDSPKVGSKVDITVSKDHPETSWFLYEYDNPTNQAFLILWYLMFPLFLLAAISMARRKKPKSS